MSQRVNALLSKSWKWEVVNEAEVWLGRDSGTAFPARIANRRLEKCCQREETLGPKMAGENGVRNVNSPPRLVYYCREIESKIFVCKCKNGWMAGLTDLLTRSSFNMRAVR